MTTPAGPKVSLQVDDEAGAAYLRLSANPVARTVEFNDDIWVDVDELNVVVGVEVLDLDTSVPLDELAAKHHVDSRTLALLKSVIRTSPAQHVAGASTSHAATSLSAGRPVSC